MMPSTVTPAALSETELTTLTSPVHGGERSASEQLFDQLFARFDETFELEDALLA
jgi:hypothetical protein